MAFLNFSKIVLKSRYSYNLKQFSSQWGIPCAHILKGKTCSLYRDPVHISENLHSKQLVPCTPPVLLVWNCSELRQNTADLEILSTYVLNHSIFHNFYYTCLDIEQGSSWILKGKWSILDIFADCYRISNDVPSFFDYPQTPF